MSVEGITRNFSLGLVGGGWKITLISSDFQPFDQ